MYFRETELSPHKSSQLAGGPQLIQQRSNTRVKNQYNQCTGKATRTNSSEMHIKVSGERTESVCEEIRSVMCAAHYTTPLNLTQWPNRLVKEHNWVTYCGDLLTLPRGGPRLSGVRLPGAGDPGVANENQCNVIGCEREAGDVSNHLNHLNVTFKFLHLFGWGMISPL